MSQELHYCSYGMGTASSENVDVALSEDKTNNPNIQMLDQIILYRKKRFMCASLVYLVICNRILVTLHLIVKFPNVESKATKPSKSQMFNLPVI